ncbi:interleukin-34 isoform X1 [Salarias fasciatus]|uniref:interleukin-34 isoform X1 n=1 Tax=Salarias fasciatus TaxID=181472 RepID=UPI001176D683|nr:interleukin-34 isoform X1 [Salarias fasciatus]
MNCVECETSWKLSTQSTENGSTVHVSLPADRPVRPASDISCSDGPNARQHVHAPEDAQRQPQPQATKHNFPINYTIRVHQKEIFKLSNIRRMRLNVEGLDDLVLQRLWFQINQGVLKKIIRIMPERHPSRSYTAELERRFKDAEGVFVQSQPPEALQQELPQTVQDIWDRLTEEPDLVPESSWRFAFPKSLLDNLFHTMYCLFSECFSSEDAQQDYCEVSHWRKGRKKDLQPES